jgi:N-methylhydantoinase A
MADLVRKMSIERGHDPRRFVLMAYGGAGPLHAASYARQIGVEQVVVPPAATVFSAFGAAASDIRHSLQRSVPGEFPGQIPAMASAYASMETEARELLGRQGITALSVRLHRWADMRYARQLHDVRVPVPGGAVNAGFADKVVQAFTERYAALYGKSALLENFAARVLRVGVEAVGIIEKPVLPAADPGGPDPSAAEEAARSVHWPEAGKRLSTRVYDGLKLKPGNAIAGPALIELPGTTIALPPGDGAVIDRFGNCVITLGTMRSPR